MGTLNNTYKEEEEYRQQIRDRISTTGQEKKGISKGCLTVIILFAILFIICFIAISTGASN